MRHRHAVGTAGRQGSAGRLLGAVLAACTATGLQAAAQEREVGHQVRSGPYVFSDELGGFQVLSASGSGSESDPIVLSEELESATPVTLVIRAVGPIRPYDASGSFANGILYMRVQARNAGGQGWVEFEFELQEALHYPSTFNDGLSFDQRGMSPEAIHSDSFAEYSREFEPADKLLFKTGKVDPEKIAGFSFLITDFTPKWQFFLVQDPRIPSS